MKIRGLAFAFLAFMAVGSASAYASSLPAPVLDEPLAPAGAADQKLTVAGGCFWGMQAVFQHTKGVKQALSGYAGGKADTAHYEMVSTGTTGHAESVQITYDPSKVSLGQLLEVYFSVAHDPTELNYQGPDHGSQYRSTVFYSTPEQKKMTEAYIDQLQQAKVFGEPIATKLEPLDAFYPAEGYHQDYAKLHPNNPYIAINDLPKVRALQSTYPELYVP